MFPSNISKTSVDSDDDQVTSGYSGPPSQEVLKSNKHGECLETLGKDGLGNNLGREKKRMAVEPSNGNTEKKYANPQAARVTSGPQDVAKAEPKVEQYSHLQLPGNNEMRITNDSDRQLWEWLGADITEDEAQINDEDLVGLAIPMDDISDLDFSL